MVLRPRAAALSFSFALATLVAASPALADLTPPDVMACQANATMYRDAGAACSIGTSSGSPKDGTCQDATCSQLEYLPDGGRGSKSFACTKCVASDGTTEGTDAADGGSGTGGSSSSGGCSATGSRLVGPWLLALAVPVIVLGSRRRRAGAAKKPAR